VTRREAVAEDVQAEWSGDGDVATPPRDRSELDRLARHFEQWSARDILQWAASTYGSGATFATGFGAEGCVIVDLVAHDRLPIDLFTLDTGLFFPETYALWRRLEERYGVVIRAVRPDLSVAEQAARHGDRLWDRAPDRCCQMRKLEPLGRALRERSAWLTAIRRDQSPDRADTAIVEWDARFGVVKINPLARWSRDDVWRYIRAHDVPTNGLHERGYPSIGCWPCTTPVVPGEDLRAGRWRGRAKTECGLHLVSRAASPSPSDDPQAEPTGALT
jgi:phosphoadenosine phosphosulfate reductase